MATAIKTRRTRMPQPRIARLMMGNVLALTAGTDTTFYRLTILDHGFGQAAFRLSKADRGDGPGDVYDVLIDGPRSSCECLGFLRHRHCKHLEALESLIVAGKLPARQVTTPAAQCNDYDDP